MPHLCLRLSVAAQLITPLTLDSLVIGAISPVTNQRKQSLFSSSLIGDGAAAQ